ncbi:MAG: 2Fe-2S iron-sulfur cluster-binding protein [Acidobacteriota bacterium]
MPLIRIDDREIEATQGETVLRAALRNGVYIPYYCYHPALSVVGQCRMCLVEVKGAPKLLTACSTTIPNLPADKKIDGKYDMVVETRNPTVKQAQKGILEFLLLNHPLDCPVCDQAGECQLQNYSYTYGAPGSRMEFEKVHAPKRVDIGPHVVYDAERCIKCTRCIRFCEEISKTGELTLAERGVHTVVDTFPGRSLDNPYSVCTADICPVGALTSREFRFKERVWFLNSANSVCPECSRGCSVRMDAYKGEVLRLVPRENVKVNGYWMCDYGRLLSERLKGERLAARPLVRGSQGWTALPAEGFLPKLVERLRPYTGEASSQMVFLLSGRMTLEEMAAFLDLKESLFPAASVSVLNEEKGEDDGLLIRKERRPNLRGARLLGLPVAEPKAPAAELLGGRRAAVILREDPLGDAAAAGSAALKEALAALDLLVVADYAFTKTAQEAHLYLPLAGWHEMEGLTVNFLGVVQKTARAVVPPRHRRPFYDWASRWMRLSGGEAPDPEFLPWLGRVKARVPALRDVSVRDLLPQGIQLEEVAP